MLTPIFELFQDDKYVKALIYAPFAKVNDFGLIDFGGKNRYDFLQVSETEIEFDGREVLFSSKPYFLRLYLPEEVVENGEESACYDAETSKWLIFFGMLDLPLVG